MVTSRPEGVRLELYIHTHMHIHIHIHMPGNRLVVTSRPEGVRLELYIDRFIVINLLQLSDQQQRKVISSQMKGNVFFDHLVSLSVIRKGQDEIYEQAFPAETKHRQKVEGLRAPNLFLLADGSRDPAMRQHDVTADHVVTEREAAGFEALGAALTSSHIKRLHELLNSPIADQDWRTRGGDGKGPPLAPSSSESLPRDTLGAKEEEDVVGGEDVEEPPPPAYITLLGEAINQLPGDASIEHVGEIVSSLPPPATLAGASTTGAKGTAPSEATAAEELQMLHEVATSLGMLALRRRTDERSFRILKDRRKEMGMVTPRRISVLGTPRADGAGVNATPRFAGGTPRAAPPRAAAGGTPRQVAHAAEPASASGSPAVGFEASTKPARPSLAPRAANRRSQLATDTTNSRRSLNMDLNARASMVLGSEAQAPSAAPYKSPSATPRAGIPAAAAAAAAAAPTAPSGTATAPAAPPPPSPPPSPPTSSRGDSSSRPPSPPPSPPPSLPPSPPASPPPSTPIAAASGAVTATDTGSPDGPSTTAPATAAPAPTASRRSVMERMEADSQSHAAVLMQKVQRGKSSRDVAASLPTAPAPAAGTAFTPAGPTPVLESLRELTPRLSALSGNDRNQAEHIWAEAIEAWTQSDAQDQGGQLGSTSVVAVASSAQSATVEEAVGTMAEEAIVEAVLNTPESIFDQVAGEKADGVTLEELADFLLDLGMPILDILRVFDELECASHLAITWPSAR